MKYYSIILYMGMGTLFSMGSDSDSPTEYSKSSIISNSESCQQYSRSRDLNNNGITKQRRSSSISDTDSSSMTSFDGSFEQRTGSLKKQAPQCCLAASRCRPIKKLLRLLHCLPTPEEKPT